MIRLRSRSTFSSPTIVAATSANAAVASVSFTSAANSRRKSTRAVAPNPAATPSAVRFMFSSTSVVSLRKVRTVPPIAAVCGITL
jgi:hypothetical protein